MRGPNKNLNSEDALGASEEQIKQLLYGLPVAMVVAVGTEDHVEILNDKFTQLFGYTMWHIGGCVWAEGNVDQDVTFCFFR